MVSGLALRRASLTSFSMFSLCPSTGPVNPDLRRGLRLSGVGDMAFLLRRDSTDGYGPPLSLETLDAVEEFFESLSHQDAMYGWRFFDEPSLTED